MTSTVDRTRTLAYNAVNVGDEVTPLDVPVTTTLIVAGAIASRDYMPVHHDRDFANSQGSWLFTARHAGLMQISALGNWGVPHSLHRPPTMPRSMSLRRHKTVMAVWVGASARIPISVSRRSLNFRNWV